MLIEQTQAGVVETSLASTPHVLRLQPRTEWHAKRATVCQGDLVSIFAWRRELLPGRPPGYIRGGFRWRTPQRPIQSRMFFVRRTPKRFDSFSFVKTKLRKASRHLGPPCRPNFQNKTHFCSLACVWSKARFSGLRANTSRQRMRQRDPPLHTQSWRRNRQVLVPFLSSFGRMGHAFSY